MGGTEGLARMLGEGLRRDGLEVELLPCAAVADVKRFDAVIVGGALYANRWHVDARRFVNRFEAALRKVPVWFFSSGPLDESAERQTLAPTRQVEVLMVRIGAQGHKTFGGRLAPDAKGFPARMMAKKLSGDWRRRELVHAWAEDVARALPTARPRPLAPLPGRSWTRLALHGAVGWGACAATMGLLLATLPLHAALLVHGLVVPVLFGGVAQHYFREPGARDPLPAALGFVAVTALLDLVFIGGVVHRGVAIFGSVAGTWVPFLLVFVTTWCVGEVMSTLPWPKGPAARPRATGRAHA